MGVRHLKNINQRHWERHGTFGQISGRKFIEACPLVALAEKHRLLHSMHDR